MSEDNRRKRVIYRASHRGIKEMDILLGGYARAHVPDMDERNLALLEDVLAMPDQQLYAWITGAEPVPDGLHNAQFVEFRDYCFARHENDR